MKDAPLFKYLLIGLELSDSGIETVLQTWSNVEYNPLVHNSVFEAVIDGIDKSEEDEEEDEEEDKADAQEV